MHRCALNIQAANIFFSSPSLPPPKPVFTPPPPTAGGVTAPIGTHSVEKGLEPLETYEQGTLHSDGIQFLEQSWQPCGEWEGLGKTLGSQIQRSFPIGSKTPLPTISAATCRPSPTRSPCRPGSLDVLPPFELPMLGDLAKPPSETPLPYNIAFGPFPRSRVQQH